MILNWLYFNTVVENIPISLHIIIYYCWGDQVYQARGQWEDFRTNSYKTILTTITHAPGAKQSGNAAYYIMTYEQ